MKVKANTPKANLVTRIALVLVLASGVAGCAHGPEKDHALDEKLSTESDVSDYADLRTQTEKIVDQSAQLTSEQKSKLVELKVETATKLDLVQKEILKLKGVLVRNIVADKYQPQEVLQIEKKIEALSKQKLTIFFASLEKGSKILGKVSAKEQILQELHLETQFRTFREGRP